jgi:hypothetical protein
MPRTTLLVMLLVLSACAGPSRSITGTAPRITVEQTSWLEQSVERDCADIPQTAGKRVQIGHFIARLDGEMFAGEHLMKAAMRGLLDAGVHVFDGGQSGVPVDYVLTGSAFLASEMAEEGRKAIRKYSFVLSLKDLDGEVRWTQSYAVTNAMTQPRYK